jgi:hypothetical protein
MKKYIFFYLLIGILINCTSYETKYPMNPQGGFIVKKDLGDDTLLFCTPPKDAERAYCYEVKEKQ